MKKIFISLFAVIVILVGVIAWYNTPIDLLDLDSNEVMEIVIFNGNTGNTTYIEDKAHIRHIIDNLNDIEIKREMLSAGYTGYSFNVTIHMFVGNNTNVWNNFIINSDDTIIKDPFIYRTAKGKIDYNYIAGIVK